MTQFLIDLLYNPGFSSGLAMIAAMAFVGVISFGQLAIGLLVWAVLSVVFA